LVKVIWSMSPAKVDSTMANEVRRRMPLMALALMAGCSQAPAYRPQQIALPETFREAGPWVPAAPAPPQAASGWWKALGDPALDELEARLERDNPDLQAALARHREALAALGEVRAATMPTLGVGANATANRQSSHRPLRGANQPDLYDADTLGIAASYEIDLWGRIGNAVQGARAKASASQQDVAAIRLALEADLASSLIALRGVDDEIGILDDAVAVYRRADEVTRHRFDGGIASGIDVGRADAQLADAEAQLADLRNIREGMDHALASLVGTPASSFSVTPISVRLAPLAFPPVLPSTLLQRRPDIAAAERRMYAANRSIGVARAAWFPAIELGGNVGYQSTALASLVSAPNLLWSVGPQVVATLFDGGRRHARLAAAHAQWDEATSQYRATVLKAVQQVEDGLSRWHRLGEEGEAEDRAAVAAGQAARLSYDRYIKGAANLLDVITAQTGELTARRRAEQIHSRRLQVSVGLVRAMGGA
jgi:NodT family efflux transporter outer membrane factor (OMF) lipoprotein